jgi:hypothetical protein
MMGDRPRVACMKEMGPANKHLVLRISREEGHLGDSLRCDDDIKVNIT